MIAWIIQKWREAYPHFTCGVIAHRKELVQQNAEELKHLYPGCRYGIFCAALGRKDLGKQITFASIDSIYRRAADFPPFDVIIVDEAHRIPFKGEGKYLQFIREAKRRNPRMVVCGFTATPYRMTGGNICGPNYTFQEICYEIGIGELIREGYLLNLRSKVSKNELDLSKVRKRGNDYSTSSLVRVTNQKEVIETAIEEAVRILYAEKRRSTIFFCVDVEHCKAVTQELAMWGLSAAYVTNKTKAEDRTRVAELFRNGRLNSVCNVNVFTEGFNVKRVDSIVLLRPTLSKGLYVQMVGRGSRLFPGLNDCLVLDFAGCIDEHGPVDAVEGDDAPIVVCSECSEAFQKPIGACPACGWKLPKREVNREDGAEEPVRLLHGKKPAEAAILSSGPKVWPVHSVMATIHRKEGKPDSIRVTYRSDRAMFKEWICPDHEGHAGVCGRRWLEARGVDINVPKLGPYGGSIVRFALSDLFLPQKIKDFTKTISVRKKGRRWDVVDYNQKERAGE